MDSFLVYWEVESLSLVVSSSLSGSAATPDLLLRTLLAGIEIAYIGEEEIENVGRSSTSGDLILPYFLAV